MNAHALSDADLARLQLEAIHRQAQEERLNAEPNRAQPLPADKQAAFTLLKRIEESEARPYQGQLGQLVSLLRTEAPDIIAEINHVNQKPGLWARILRTLNLD